LPRDIATFLKFRKNIANLVVILEASVLSPLKKKEKKKRKRRRGNFVFHSGKDHIEID